MATAITEDMEDVYIGGVRDAIDYILETIDKDSDFIYPEKEVIKLFFQYDTFKSISILEFKDFLKLLQQHKNNLEENKQVSYYLTINKNNP